MAFSFEAATWKALAGENRKVKHLSMACCGRQVVLKTSHLGTRFFAHARRADSACPVESEDHLLAKEIVARATLSAGWQADTEVPMQPDGVVADVLASKGRVRVAFEIQCSRQKEAETKRRHRVYERLGVRSLWLFKQADYPRWREIPAFRIVRDKEKPAFDVWVWREGHDYQKVSEPAQKVPLDRFIAGALLGRLKWGPAIGLSVPMLVHVVSARCRRGHLGSALKSVEFGIGTVLPGHPNARVHLHAFGEQPNELRSATVRGFLDQHGLALDFRVANWPLNRREDSFHRYVNACCATCGVYIGPWEGDETAPAKVLATGHSVQLSDAFVRKVPGLSAQLARWWLAPYAA